MIDKVLDEIPNPNDFFVTIEGWKYDQRFDVSAYLNARDKWLEEMGHYVYAGEQAIKWGYFEIHWDTDPVTYTIHCGLKEDAEKWQALKGFFHKCCPSCGSINVDWKKAYCRDCFEQFLQIRGDWLDDYIHRVHGEELYKAEKWDKFKDMPINRLYFEFINDRENKLEAIRELNREYSAKEIWELDLVEFHNFRAKLRKILEGEE